MMAYVFSMENCTKYGKLARGNADQQSVFQRTSLICLTIEFVTRKLSKLIEVLFENSLA